MHAAHAQVVIVGIRQRRSSHHGQAHRRVQTLRQLQKLILRLRGNHAASAVDKGLSGCPDRLQHRLSVVCQHRLLRHLRQHRDTVLALTDLHVLRNINQHRTLAPGIGNLECLLDGLLQLGHRPDHEVVLHDRLGNADDIHLLEAVPPQGTGGYVAGDGDQGHRIQVGIGDAGHQIGSSGTAGGDHYAHLAGCSRVTVRRVAGSLLMGGNHVIDAIGTFIELIVDIQHGAARITEYRRDALMNQLFDENSCSSEFHVYLRCPRLAVKIIRKTLQRQTARPKRCFYNTLRFLSSDCVILSHVIILMSTYFIHVKGELFSLKVSDSAN